MTSRKISTLVFVFALVSSASSVQAGGLSLVGFDLYSSGSDGSNANSGYRYSSNSNDTSAYYQQLTPAVGSPQTQGISLPLHEGFNTFSFAVGCCGSANPGTYAGVDLFFSGNGTSFNPTSGTIPGDLAAFVPTAGGAFEIPTAGTLLQNFAPGGGGGAAYSGATSFMVGADTITVTALSIGNTPSGSITLFATPEPSSVFLGACGTIGLFFAARRRRKT